ncbi:LacI family transcriptional regulator [Demequina sp. TTPB684]|uniref:LacI family DNA-binding transcriptional regulator n=1 Tax=unclassified Demequina TaxID=2620311 RepID=UPI001CF49579|nr:MULTISPECIES: LacI family DNA-binding transcriptional regulator [unclassified Demequina]MCB2413007.1 LacI family transcriptional regulator [Demequina sp. TTPB684]UPU87076.1 LacI family transcriptional regulator [Demequina sp. TMPB413]
MSERRPVTLADVAQAAGVAKSTASYAFSDPSRLSPTTTQRVLDAARELGYSGPSALGRALASGRTSVVAVVTRALLESPDTDPFALRVVDGISRELASLGYGVLLLPPITDAATRKLHAGAIYDAAITVRRIDGIEETDAMLAQRGVPWVRLDGTPDEEKAVAIDAQAPSIELLTALVGWGHERIATVALRPTLEETEPALLHAEDAKALVEGLPGSVPQRVPRARLEAFARVGVMPSHVAVCPIVTREHAYDAGKELLSLPVGVRPTAIVCQADVYAWGVWDAARDLGLRVPEDVSITGFDGLTEGVFAHLDLTSVVQDGTQKGRLIARWVALACASDELPPPFDLPLAVRWGSSAGPAPEA